ncbi:hypothetical protein GCM10027347_50960 [Larkinella harenae]
MANTLGKLGQRILVIDADNQGTIAEIRQDDRFRLLARNKPLLFPWDLKMANPSQAQLIIEEAYEADQYDLIFIDMPRMTGLEDDAILSLLTMADSFLIPIKAQRGDAMSAAHFMATMRDLKKIREEEGFTTYVYGFHNQWRNITENEDVPPFAEDNGIELFTHIVKFKKIFEHYNTYTSLLETKEGREEFGPFLNEFIQKYELDIIVPEPI